MSDSGAVVDLFAGPGGWDYAATQLGLDPVGIETDPDTIATREAAGLATVAADLSDPNVLCSKAVDGHINSNGTLSGLIASPPCPSFSAAGKGHARADIDTLVSWFDRGEMGDPDSWVPRLETGPSAITADAVLCVEPFRWAEQYGPAWIALEQVPPVLPIWQAGARWLQNLGYHTWTGVLCAADYGVPQQRYRAFLLARLDRPVTPPVPTHAETPQLDLFGRCPEPWVTMAEALNLPAGPTNKTTGPVVLNQYDNRDHRPPRAIDKPAPTVTTKATRWQWQLDPREYGKPLRSLDYPAQTVTGSSVNNWVFRRPATTVQGDSRIWPPGHKINRADIERLGRNEAERRYSGRAGSDAVKVEPWQAAVLQSFPPCYPFRGSKSSQAKQIGNAVPPLLACQVLGALIGS